MARRATKIKQVRGSVQNVLLLDAGNALYAAQGVNKTTQGKYMVEAMNRLGYDAMLLGDQDFAWGVDVLKQRIAEARFPVLSANVFVGGGGIGFLLVQWINLLQYRQAATAVWAIAAVVAVMDYASAVVREKVV